MLGKVAGWAYWDGVALLEGMEREREGEGTAQKGKGGVERKGQGGLRKERK